MQQPVQPIGVFDSGIGGLTVLKALKKILPKESFIYLGDTARLPYGSKSPETIRRYLIQNINFLKAQNVKAIVIACNSASSVLEENDDFGIPVYNVITPGALKAIQESTNKNIGVFATTATVSGLAYMKAIKKIDSNAHVFQKACPLLVPLVEEGLEDDEITSLAIKRYWDSLSHTQIDTLILGCTHYPVLKSSMQKIVGTNIKLVDSAETIAQKVALDIQNKKINPAPPETKATLKVSVTDASPTFTFIAEKLMLPFTIDEWATVTL